ncbi:melatonin receptor type 1A-like [Rhopilema esculentum]|uniref:melatonin receptor type 1A-like n=1 Tax=Rhopilema esculentum TaxID=499914 RepID=UPI0031D155C1|eukprot:gene8433-14417_t
MTKDASYYRNITEMPKDVGTINNASVGTSKDEMAKGKNSLALTFITLLNCLNIAGIALNTMIIIVYRRNRQLKTKSNIIIVSMAITSIVLASSEMICSTRVFISWTNARWYLNGSWCALQSCLEAILCHFTIHAIAAMAIQRQNIISKILKPNIQTKLLRTKLLLLATLTYITLISIPMFFYFQTSWVNLTMFLGCESAKRESSGSLYYRAAYIGILFAIPFVVIFINYIYIHYRIKQKSLPLQRELKRRQLRKGANLRADSYSGLNIIVILSFSTLFSLPTEVLSMVFKENMLSGDGAWIFYAAAVMSKIFEMFSALVHACASTRYRVKLRKSFITSGNTEFSLGQQKESAVSQRKGASTLPDDRVSSVRTVRRRQSSTVNAGRKLSERRRSFDRRFLRVSLQANETATPSVSTKCETEQTHSDICIHYERQNGKKTEAIELNVLRETSKGTEIRYSDFENLEHHIQRRMSDSEVEKAEIKINHIKMTQLRVVSSLSRILSLDKREAVWKKWQLANSSV